MERNRRIKKRRNAGKKQIKLLSIGVLALFLAVFMSVKETTVASAGTADSSRYKYYTSIEVEGETNLWEIACEYMTEEYVSQQDYIKEVKRMNHLTSDVIYEGAYLCIPYYASEQK